jgi:hypothetical protein
MTQYSLYITLPKAEEMTGLTVRSIKRLIKEGKVVGFRPTYKTLLVKQESLISYIDSRQVNS